MNFPISLISSLKEKKYTTLLLECIDKKSMLFYSELGISKVVLDQILKNLEPRLYPSFFNQLNHRRARVLCGSKDLCNPLATPCCKQSYIDSSRRERAQEDKAGAWADLCLALAMAREPRT